MCVCVCVFVCVFMCMCTCVCEHAHMSSFDREGGFGLLFFVRFSPD